MNKIEDLIPQRAPIVMVDTFCGIAENVSSSELTVREDNIFVDNDYMSECGVIEHIAQSAAARVGYIFTQKGSPVPLGYIGAVNDFTIYRLPTVGETITTSINVVQEVFNITLIEARCQIADEVIAGCKMKIFLEQ